MTLTGASTYTGQTTVNAGTLTMGNADAAHTLLASPSCVVFNPGGTLLLAGPGGTGGVAPVTPAGGTLNLGGQSQGIAGTNGLGALTLTVTSTLDFGLTGTSNLIQFGGVGTHTSGARLQVANWEGMAGRAGGADRLLFAGTPDAFTSVYSPGEVSFNGAAGYGVQAYDGFYEVFSDVTAVPEPATWVAGALLVGAATFTLRGRRRAGGV